MIIASGEEMQIKTAVLPPVWARNDQSGPLRIRQLAAPEELVVCTASAVQTRAGRINRLILEVGNDDSVLIETLSAKDLFQHGAKRRLLLQDSAAVQGSALVIPRRHVWEKHPQLASAASPAEAAHASWTGALSFVEEQTSPSSPGLRPPQIGALHAIAAHWTVSPAPALVVMPTGTGKTEVMLAVLIMSRPKRVLVVVPTDLLREQTFDKFTHLGVLRAVGAVSASAQLPVVAVIRGSLDTESLKKLEECNVVVTTMAALGNLGVMQLKKLVALFDMVFFDEAHHLPAMSWERLSDRLSQHAVLQFTATPFRLDGRRIPGRMIYNFPLRLAQKQGYFQEIDFVEVMETDAIAADRMIAEAAVARLRKDRAAGLTHMLLARVDTKARAEALFAAIYKPLYADLDPVLIHSGTPQRRKVLRDIRERKHAIVVCVDMFGEGYDLPQLKVAALHDIHRSLAVTLQFTGRFTRMATGLGTATIVANVADPRVSEAIEELYAEDSDWNEIIPKLSAKAIQSQSDFSDFLQKMEKSDIGDDDLFALNVLRPKMSTVIFRASSFSPRSFRQGVKKGIHIQRVWISRDRDYLVFITKTRSPIDWASIKEVSNETWDLFVVAHDSEQSLIYIHSSNTSTLHSELAKSVGGKGTAIVDGEAMFRALHPLKRITLQNVGLKPRGNKLRFHMFVGPDVVDMITPAAQINSAKSNLFAMGFDDGKRVSVGVSTKGRVWSRTSGSIPDWRNWCAHVAKQITDSKIPTEEYLKHTLIPTEVALLPATPIFGVALPVEWYMDEMDAAQILADGKQIDLHFVGITGWSSLASDSLEVCVGAEKTFNCVFELKWGPANGQFVVTQKSGLVLSLRHRGHEAPFADYLQHAPPTIFMCDGSELNGGLLHAPRDAIQHTLDLTLVQPWDWTNVDITEESAWRNGVYRSNSVQARVMEIVLAKSNAVVFDDDDAGESADVVEIIDRPDEVVFRFYHCKFSLEARAGQRADDLYVVCGQAVRSTRWNHNPVHLVEHLQRRASASGLNGRPTRFAKGDQKTLIRLKRKVRQVRVRHEVAIVQPGISKVKLEPKTTAILGAASNFILEMTGAPLSVITSV